MGHRLLIVDDNPGFRLRARRRLESAGFTVVAEAADGRSALEAVREHRPGVVLPDVSGLAVARQLAGDPGAPAVVLTSTRHPADYGGAIERSGARGFLPKDELSGPALERALA